MRVGFKTIGDWTRTFKYLTKLGNKEYLKVLDSYGAAGVEALASATPRETGETASSWTYEIEYSGGGNVTIAWRNSKTIRTGEPLVILLQYGHGTGTGGYVMGYDFINPAIRPIFDEISEQIHKSLIEG